MEKAYAPGASAAAASFCASSIEESHLGRGMSNRVRMSNIRLLLCTAVHGAH